MGCTSSSHSATKKEPFTSQQILNFNTQVYANVKKRTGPPTVSREDGYDQGLRVRDNVCGLYSLYIGTARKTGEKVTIKEYTLTKGSQFPDLENRLVAEVATLARLGSHAGCPPLREVFVVEGQSMFIVTDYVDNFRLKNYLDLRSMKSQLSLPEVRKVFKAMLSIVIHAQEQSVILRNLTLDNVMVVKKARRPSKEKEGSPNTVPDFDVRLTDVAQAADLGGKEAITEHPQFDWNSQLQYLSPELALKLPFSSATDIWSLGVLLYAMIAGELPFTVEDAMDRAKLIDKIKNADFSFGNRPDVWNPVRKEIKSLISSMLVSDPVNRATAAEVRRNEWVLNG